MEEHYCLTSLQVSQARTKENIKPNVGFAKWGAQNGDGIPQNFLGQKPTEEVHPTKKVILGATPLPPTYQDFVTTNDTCENRMKMYQNMTVIEFKHLKTY